MRAQSVASARRRGRARRRSRPGARTGPRRRPAPPAPGPRSSSSRCHSERSWSSSSTMSPSVVHARVAARVVQQHQREQAAHLGLVGHERAEHAGEPDRLVAQLAAHERVGARGEVALVEDQVERRRAPSAGAPGSWWSSGHLVADARRADLALGPHQPLLHRRLAGQEGPRDLGGGEAAERAQRERHARLGRERRVAAGEEQAQPVVGDRCSMASSDSSPPPSSLQLAQLLRVAALAAQAVDRAVARGAHDPAARVGRDAVARPALERDRERLLHRLLGAGRSRRGCGSGSRPPAPTRAGTGGRRPRRGLLAAEPPPLLRVLGAGGLVVHDRPHLDRAARAPGIFAAQSIASSRSLQSSR